MKFSFLISILLFSNVAYPQDLESLIFKSICHDILKNEQDAELQAKFNGIFLAEVDMNDTIIYSADVSQKTKNEFKSYKLERQLEILKASKFPFNENSDTIKFVDKINYFKSNHNYLDKYYFRLNDHPENEGDPFSNIFTLEKAGINKNVLVLVFSINTTPHYLYYCRVKIENAKVIPEQSSKGINRIE